MSQSSLAEKLGVAFQQVQKYEKGTNRIGASRLHGIAEALGVPVTYFFDDAAATAAPSDIKPTDRLTSEGMQLNRAFFKIHDSQLRCHLVDLVQSIADAADEDGSSSRRTRRTDRTEPR